MTIAGKEPELHNAGRLRIGISAFSDVDEVIVIIVKASNPAKTTAC
jgi:hypothetical protein